MWVTGAGALRDMVTMGREEWKVGKKAEQMVGEKVEEKEEWKVGEVEEWKATAPM